MDFLCIYRGAALYEVDKEEPGVASKVLAKAFISNKNRVRIAFAEQADTQKKAVEKVKKKIDTYLNEHPKEKLINEIGNHLI